LTDLGICFVFWLQRHARGAILVLFTGINTVLIKPCQAFRLDITLLETKHVFYVVHVGRMHHGIFCQSTLAVSGFLCQNVPFERMLSLDFAGTRNHKALLRRGFRLHFWHFACF
jgi:hypothetical protein